MQLRALMPMCLLVILFKYVLNTTGAAICCLCISWDQLKKFRQYTAATCGMRCKWGQ